MSGIAVDGQEVGVVARPHPALAVAEPAHLRGGRRARGERLGRAHPQLGELHEPVGQHAVRLDRGDARVGARHHHRALADQPGVVRLDVREDLRAARAVARPAARSGTSPSVAPTAIRRRTMAATRSSGATTPVAVGEGAVLKTVDPGRDAVDDRLERVGVGGDRKAVPVRFVDQRREVVGGELPAVDVGARGQEAAGGHHLDDVDAALGVLADGVPHPALGDAAEEVAVAAGRGDRRARRDDRRATAGAASRAGARAR